MLLSVAPLLLNCHLLGKTSTKRTNVILVPIGYSESTAVLPTGRKIGRITQKEPCKGIGLTNPQPNFGKIFPERAKMGLTHQQFCPFNPNPHTVPLIPNRYGKQGACAGLSPSPTPSTRRPISHWWAR